MIPNLRIMAPKDSRELAEMLKLAVEGKECAAIRYPRGEVHDEILRGLGVTGCTPVEFGRAEVISQGSDITFVAVGSMVAVALQAAAELRKRGLDVGVINARWVKPLDEEIILETAANTQWIVTLEENVLSGGFGSAVLEVLQEADLLSQVGVKCIGIPDSFVGHGDNAQLVKDLGLDAHHLVEKVMALSEKNEAPVQLVTEHR
jgi:1-deoxy-D-xylulose-5-phosphate synthase